MERDGGDEWVNYNVTEAYAPKELNLGSVLFKENGALDSVVTKYTDAWVGADGGLIVGAPNSDNIDVASFPQGVTTYTVTACSLIS